MADVNIQFQTGSGETAGHIPIVLDIGGQVANYLSRRLKGSELPWATDPEFNYKAIVNHSTGVVSGPPNFTDLPDCGINCYLHPNGASRFGRGLFLVSHEHIEALINTAWGVSWDGTGGLPPADQAQASLVTLEMTGPNGGNAQFPVDLLTPIQLDVTTEGSGEPRQLWLCPVVDARYRLLHTPFDPATLDVKSSTNKTWAQVATALVSDVATQVTAFGTVDTAFLYPDPGYFSTQQSIAYALDHVACSTGRRIAFDPVANQILIYARSNADQDFDTAVTSMRAAGFPIILGEAGGNPVAPTAQEYRFDARKLYDYYDNNSWEKKDGTSGNASGDTPKFHTISTFYLEYLGGNLDSGSEQRWDALCTALSEENRAWQQKQFCVTHVGVPSNSSQSLMRSPYTDYTYIKVGSDGDNPSIATTHKSVPIGVIPQVNISQTQTLYRHNQELARVTLGSGGIQQGASSGQGNISPNKSETSYDGNPQQITVNLVAPAGQAIPAGSVLSVYFQSNDGWYVVQGEAGPPGGSGAPWIQFRLINAVGSIQSGQWSAYVLQFRNCENILDDADEPITCGSPITVYDPFNLFPDAVFEADQNITNCLTGTGVTPPGLGGSVGTAHYRTPATGCNNPPGENRWEAETCTQSVNRIEGTVAMGLNGCIKAAPSMPGETYPISFTLDDFYLSESPNRDFPMEARDATTEEGNCWAVDAENPYALTLNTGERVILERWSRKNTTRATSPLAPHNEAQSDVRWVIAEVLKSYYGDPEGEIARYILVELLDSATNADFQGQGSAQGDYFALNDYWEGTNPAAFGNSYTDTCRPKIVFALSTVCKEAGTQYVGSFDPGRHLYMLFATESAMLGEPIQLTSVTQATAAGNCGLTFTQQQHYGFPCDFLPTAYTWNPVLQQIDVVTSAGTSGNQLCLFKDTILVCDYEQGETQCIDICICNECSDYNCTWVYDENTGYWNQTETCPQEFANCDCTGEAPTGTPAPGEPTTISYPCATTPDPPSNCITCDQCQYSSGDCDAYGVQLTIADMTGTNDNNDSVVIDLATVVITGGANCTWTVQATWRNLGTGQSVQASATVTMSATTAIGSCPTVNGELTFAWSPATFGGITLPTNLGGSNAFCNDTYGNQGGCGVLPNSPSQFGFWNVVSATVTCCGAQGGQTAEENLRAYLEASKTEIVAGSGFSNARLGGTVPKTAESSLPLGDAFAKDYPLFFQSCGCTKDVVRVMNRWDAKKSEPTEQQAETVSRTLHKKLPHEHLLEWPLDKIKNLIITYTQKHFGDQ